MSRQYIEIRKYVQKKIESSEWPVGYKIPREIDLCRQFEVSRTTVQRGLAPLVAEGKLHRIKGTGTFVSSPQLFDKTSFFIQSFAEELKSRNLTCVTEILELRTYPATEDKIIEEMGLSKREKVFKIRRLRYSRELEENGPMVLTTSYFPEDIGEKIQQYDFEKITLYRALQISGIHRVRSVKTISATKLSAKDCRLLHASEDDLFLLVTTKAWDENNRKIEYCESYYPVDRHVFTINITTG